MSKVRILIVEDQMITATDIQGILIRFGYEVVGIVSSGKKAIEKAAKGKVDLVLMDIVLKGSMDGIEAAEQIDMRDHAEHYPGIRRVGVHQHATERAYELLDKGTTQ